MTPPLSFTGESPVGPRQYDPHYDPLVAANPGAGRAYAPSYWVASAGTPPPDDGPIRAEPFNAPLNRLDNDPACAQVITALRAAGRLAGV